MGMRQGYGLANGKGHGAGRSVTTTGASLLVAAATLAQGARAQAMDSASQQVRVAGAVSVTTKGISTIPSFTLGRPAAIFNLAVAKRALSFEPELRFELNGKPWTFVFWWRYKLVDDERLHLTIGAHPALSFKTMRVSADGATRDVVVARRYWAAEVNPSYALSHNISVGPYYLYSYGVEQNVARNTHFLAMRVNLTSGLLPDQYLIRLAPQVYYLKADRNDGYYVYTGLTLAKRDIPLSLSAVVNRTIRTAVPSEDVLWNMSLNYTFAVR